MTTEVFMEVAIAISKLSKDPSTRVGCVLVSPDRKLMSTGFNGFPSGLPESERMWADRTSKDLICKHTAVLHAEENALLNARQSVAGWTAYVTHHPCVRCMGMLGHSGIKHVVYANPIKPEYRPELAAILASQMGISVQWVKAYSSITLPAPTVAAKTTLGCSQTAMGSVSDVSIEQQAWLQATKMGTEPPSLWEG